MLTSYLRAIIPVMALLAASPTVAQAPTVNLQSSLPALGSGFGDIASRLEPAVVAISAKTTARGAPRNKAHQGSGGSATGSGFVIDGSGIVVTNNHVIEGADAFEVVFSNGTRRNATLVGRDTETDIAVLRTVAGPRLPAVPWGNSDQARIGDWAIAIGSPFGLGNSLSVGVISGRNRDLQAGRYDDFLQTDAAINRGNSGGPLFNARGEVIGVNTAIVSPGGAQGGSVGVGFAVPSNLARRIVADILRTGSAQRGWIGLRARSLSEGEGGNGQNGIVVADVAPRSPAAVAGLRTGDRITTWGGQAVTDPRALARFVASANIGARVRLEGSRGRQRIFANMIVGAPNAERRPPATSAAPIATAMGLAMRAATPQDRPRLPENVAVVVTGVDAFGPARTMVQVGDGLIEVQGRRVTSPQNARAALEEAARTRDGVVIRLHRGGQSIYRALRPVRR
jgi:serine protease Do